jgi:DNA-binding response OmpR family regulator
MAENYRILQIEDDPLQVSLVGRALRAEGFEVQSADSALGVTNMARSFEPHLVLLDVRIPELSGDRLVVLLRKIVPKGTLLVLFSAMDTDQLRKLATACAADGWISKNDEFSQLGTKLRALIEQARPSA